MFLVDHEMFPSKNHRKYSLIPPTKLLLLLCSIALFCSEEKGNKFVPQAEEKKCTIISSKTGKLIDIDVEAVRNAIQTFNVSLALV